MVRFEEMTVGARRVRGPISDLVDLDLRGVAHVAVAFGDDWRDHAALVTGLDPYRDFLELPMAEGVAPLVACRNGVFAYRAPRGRTARELIGVWAEEGGGGVRAALELVVEGTLAIAEAARAGADRGLRGHGSLDPWRILIHDTGKVTLLGYGLPPLEMLEFQRDEKAVPPLDALRYCPPERLDGDPDDWTADLFTLALAAIELTTGKPVYDGRPQQVLDQAGTGEANKRLDGVPKELVAVLRNALAPFPDQRPSDPMIVVDLARKALARLEGGQTLAELVTGAQPYLSDVEDDVPAGFTILDLVGQPPDEPQRQAAIARATECSGRAAAVAEALAARIDDAAIGVNDALPAVLEAMTNARRALDIALEAATRADQAADEALASFDAPAAEVSAARAEAAAEDIATQHHVIDDALLLARKLTDESARADSERRDAAITAARGGAVRAEAALAALPNGGLGADDVDEQVSAAKAAAEEAEASRDPEAAEQAAERAIAAADAAEAEAVIARERMRVADARVDEASQFLVRAEAALSSVPAADVRESVERCRVATAESARDPEAVDRARAAAEEAEARASAGAAHRELVRRRAWIAVARADACRRGEAARAAAEVAEASMDLDEVVDAAIRAETAADEAEAAARLDDERIGAARDRVTAARAKIATAAEQWHPDGVATEVAEAEQAAESLETTTLGEEALAAAERAEQAAEAAVARARTAVRMLTVVRRRAASTLREAEGEVGEGPVSDEVIPHLEATRQAVAAARATWSPDEADTQASTAEAALQQLRLAMERVRRSDTARQRIAAVREQAAMLEPTEAALVQSALAEAEAAPDPVALEAVAGRAEQALREAAESAQARVAREAELAACRERAERVTARATELRGKVEDAQMGELQSALDEVERARDVAVARWAVERAERSLELAEAAVLDRAERERAIAAQRERAKRAVVRAVDLLDRIDTEDVRHVEAARAALAEIDRAQDLAAATAAAERAEQAATAAKAAADRRAQQAAEVERLRASAREKVLAAELPESAPPELAQALIQARSAAAKVAGASDAAAVEAAVAALDLLLAQWQQALTGWREARERRVAEARARASAAVQNLTRVAADRPDLAASVARGQAAAGRAAETEDPDAAAAAADEAEAVVADAYGQIENQQGVDLARERAGAAGRRAQAAVVEAGVLIPLAERLEHVLSAWRAADGATRAAEAVEAAEQAEAAAVALSEAVVAGREALERARQDAAGAVDRHGSALAAHPMVGEDLVDRAQTALDAALGAKDVATALAAAAKAAQVADQAEAALRSARQTDLQGVLADHREQVARRLQQADELLVRAPYADGADLRAQLAAVAAQVATSTEVDSCGALARRSVELFDALGRTILAAAREEARNAVAAVEQAATRIESAELQLHLEAARMAYAEADGTDDLGQAIEAATLASQCATEAQSALAEGLESERSERVDGQRARATAAVERVEAAAASWSVAAPRLDEVRAAAAEAGTLTDPEAIAVAAERAETLARQAVQEIREQGLATQRARGDAAVREAEALAAGHEGEALRAALEQVQAARAEVEAATSGAAAAAAAERAEWTVAKVQGALAGARIDAARRKAAEAVARAETLGDPELAPYVEQARAAARKADQATTVEAAAEAAHEAQDAVDLAQQAARELERQASVVTARLRISAAQDRVMAAGVTAAGGDPKPLLAEIEAADAEAAATDDPEVAHDAADRADRVAAKAELAARGRAVEEAAAVARSARQEREKVAPPAGAPEDVVALFSAIDEPVRATARLADQAAGADPARAPELLKQTKDGLAAVGAAIQRAQDGVAAWRRSLNNGAVVRARAAVARARAAAAEAEAIRDVPSIARAIREAEVALEAAAAAVEPIDADWSAALAISAADRADEQLTDLRVQVQLAQDAVRMLASARSELSPRVGADANLGAELESAWSRAEKAARVGDRATVALVGRQLAELQARLSPPTRAATPASAPRAATPSPAKPASPPPPPPVRSAVPAPARSATPAPARSATPPPARSATPPPARSATRPPSAPPPKPKETPTRATPAPQGLRVAPAPTNKRPSAGPTLSPSDFAALGLDEELLEAEEAPEERGGNARDAQIRLMPRPPTDGALDDEEEFSDGVDPDAQKTTMFEAGSTFDDDDPTTGLGTPRRSK